jgi:hypothetical protein
MGIGARAYLTKSSSRFKAMKGISLSKKER